MTRSPPALTEPCWVPSSNITVSSAVGFNIWASSHLSLNQTPFKKPWKQAFQFHHLSLNQTPFKKSIFLFLTSLPSQNQDFSREAFHLQGICVRDLVQKQVITYKMRKRIKQVHFKAHVALVFNKESHLSANWSWFSLFVINRKLICNYINHLVKFLRLFLGKMTKLQHFYCAKCDYFFNIFIIWFSIIINSIFFYLNYSKLNIALFKTFW